MILSAIGKSFYRQPVKDYQTDISIVSYSLSGDDLGSSYRIELYNGKVTKETKKAANYKLVKKTRRVTEKTYREIEKIVEQYDMHSWTNLGKEDFEILDGSTASFSIWFTDSVKVNISYNTALPEGGWQAVNEIKSILQKAVGEK